MSFVNKVVLVTGASSGIGAATAILFAKEGADVVMVGRNQTKLDAVAGKVEVVGKKPLVINADVTKEDDSKRIIKNTIEEFGKLDILVNNAGLINYGSILDGNVLQAYDIVINVNVRAVINLTVLATPHLMASKGNIINISSAVSMSVPLSPKSLPYCVSKAALDMFTKGAALELSSSGVRVNSVNPGITNSDFLKNAKVEVKPEDLIARTRLNRISEPEEIAHMIVYLAGEKAIGITGSIFVVDNGYLLK